MTKTDAIAEQNAVEVPLYTVLDAARYLRVPVWAPLALSVRHPPHTLEMFELFSPVRPYSSRFPDDYGLWLHGTEPLRLSFRTLATLFVRSFCFRVSPSELASKDAGRHLIDATWEILRHAESEPSLFADPDPERILRQCERYTRGVTQRNRDHLRKIIAFHLSRVELKDGVPVRFYPFSRDATPDSPRIVVIDPEIRFGRPTVKGAPSDVIAERWRAGDSPALLADDYDLTTDEVDEALRYESTPHSPCYGW